MPQSLAGWLLAAVLGIGRPETGRELSRPELGAGGWTTVDFRAATCGYVPATGLTFSLPPGYVIRNPNHGAEAGCFWGREEDLDRAFLSNRQLNFEKLDHGVFQARMTPNVSYDGKKRLFSGEGDLRQVLADAGMRDVSVSRREFARHAGLVVTGRRADGFELYMLYLARGADADVLLINYRPATPPTTSDAANWQRFLDQIR